MVSILPIKQSEYSIYCLLKNNELSVQSKIKENIYSLCLKDNKTTYDITLNTLNPSIAHMKDYFQDLYNLMVTYEKHYAYSEQICETQKYTYLNNEYVRGIIFHRVLMRKGSYFYVLQQSDRGIRFLLYAMNRVNHSSISLGWSMKIPNVSEELNTMKNELNKHTDTLADKFDIQNLATLITQDVLFFI